MKMMGWQKGDGLGKDAQGIVDPIEAKIKNNSKGLGFKPSHSIKLNDKFIDEADALLGKNKQIANCALEKVEGDLQEADVKKVKDKKKKVKNKDKKIKNKFVKKAKNVDV